MEERKVNHWTSATKFQKVLDMEMATGERMIY
jgi:hypothetical protein